MPEKPLLDKGEVKSDLPPLGVEVMVQCEGYRCMAFRNNEGKWMSAYGKRSELKNFIKVLR